VVKVRGVRGWGESLSTSLVRPRPD